MIVSIAILVMSTGLFLYWFRYTCLLILSAKTSRDYSRDVAAANRLQFVEIQSQIKRVVDPAEMDRLQVCLRRDYEVISALLRHTHDATLEGSAVEDTMLKIDYRIMEVWYGVARSLSPRHAAHAITEMCQIVGYFANSMGERSLTSAGA